MHAALHCCSTGCPVQLLESSSSCAQPGAAVLDSNACWSAQASITHCLLARMPAITLVPLFPPRPTSMTLQNVSAELSLL
jgi:hypothetical protein